MKSLPIAVLALALALPLAAPAQNHCTKETLTVRGVPLTAGYCVTGAPTSDGPEMAVPVTETYAANGQAISRTTTMRFIAGDGPSRVLENLALSGLGIAGTLHLTLLYSGGSVHVENALLTPGAITIK